MRQVTQGSTNISVDVYIIDDTDGTPELGVLFNTAGMDLEYRREGAAVTNVTEVTLAALTTAHTDGGFLEIGHGYYRFDVPDAAFASGAKSVSIQGTVTGMVVIPVTIQLTAFDMDTATQDVNMTQISGDSTAADNLEAMYDGTGYADSNAPSTQSQLDGVANVGSAVHKASSSYTLTTGVQSANLYTDTEALDGVRHTHTDSAGVLDLEYHFTIGGGTPSSVQVSGYVTGANDDVDVFGYDWVTASYKQIGNMGGSSSTSNSVYSFDLFVDMVGNGADEGKVDIMFGKTSGLTSATLAIDQVFVAFNQGVEGYDNGAVWFNSNASNTGTEVNIDGTARNPVSTSAALLALLGSTGLHKVEVTPGSTLTLGGAYEGYSVNGNGSVLALGSQNIGGSVFARFSNVTGTGTTTSDPTFFEDCIFGTASLSPYVAQQCGFGSTVSQVGAGDYTHIDCYSTVAGSGSPTFTRTGAGVATGEYRRFSGGITQSGITGSDTYTIGGELGTVTLNGASGAVELRGIYKAVTDNRTGSPTLNLDGAILGGDVAALPTAAENADQVWDELLSGHAISGSTGEALSAAGTAGDPWTTSLPGAYGAGTAGKIIGDNINAPLDTIDTVVDGIQADLSNGTDGLGAIKADTAAILVDTGTTLPASLAALNDISVADILTTQMTESYAADGVAPTLAQALFLVQQELGDFAISGTTITVKQIDGTTTAATFTLDDGTSPTSKTRAT